jgi:hypothetical protein
MTISVTLNQAGGFRGNIKPQLRKSNHGISLSAIHFFQRQTTRQIR